MNNEKKQIEKSEPHPCETCEHWMICDYCASHLENFKLPGDTNSCDMYKPEHVAVCLANTVDGMLSSDYKERFKAEYQQTKIRYDKLHTIIIKATAKTLEFELSCPISLLEEQAKNMGRYLYCLEVRAQIEGMELQ